MSVRKGNDIISGSTSNKYLPDLFDYKWSDHKLNNPSWIRADTFSWQSGIIYQEAYNHLVDESPEVTTYYFWVNLGHDERYGYTTSRTPEVGDTFYRDLDDLTDTGTITAYDSTEDGISAEYDGHSWTMTYSSETTEGLNQETIAGITISYYQAADGHKIVLIDQESNVTAIYNATGVAWYYILDTENQRFKLPRTKYGFTGLRDTVGNYVEAGLPNITATFTSDNRDGSSFHSSPTGAITETVKSQSWSFSGGGAYSSSYTRSLNASRSSSIYGNSDTVQPPATEMYLYFYVGPFTQTALENTAGLNAELFNDKVDLVGSWGFPNTQYDNITVGASGSYYTAPADGWFSIRYSGKVLMALVDSNNTELMIIWTDYAVGNGVFMPVAKGNRIRLDYGTGTTTYFRFVYAKKTN